MLSRTCPCCGAVLIVENKVTWNGYTAREWEAALCTLRSLYQTHKDPQSQQTHICGKSIHVPLYVGCCAPLPCKLFPKGLLGCLM